MFPTETVYGLGADFKNQAGVKKIFQIKGRHLKKALPVIVSGLGQIKSIAEVDKLAYNVINKFLPGPLTIILPKKKVVSGLISAGTKTVAVRYPDHSVALKLSSRFPLASSSANLSGQPACYSVSQFLKQVKGQQNLPDLILDAGRIPKVKPSTIVDLTGKKIKILRKGPVSNFHNKYVQKKISR